MNVERGFRRLTIVGSLALLLIGLAMTALEVYRAQLYVAGERQMEECLEPVARESRDGMRFKQHFRYCQETVYRPPFPPRLSHSLSVLGPLHSAGIATETTADLVVFAFEHPRLFAWLVGGILALVLAALPWGVFYLVRWIMRGFRPLRRLPHALDDPDKAE